MSRQSLLKQGKIPAGHICPYRVKCYVAAKGECKHTGFNHTNDFSCGWARAHDITQAPVFKIGQEVITEASSKQE